MKKTIALIVVAVIACVLILNRAQELSRPPLPVSVGFRQALMGPGLVAMFRNNSAVLLEVKATIQSSDINSTKTYQLVLPPNGVQEIGWLEGWSFVPGQRIDLMNNRFRPVYYLVGGGVPNR